MGFWESKDTLAEHHWVLRTLITYLWLLIVTRFMGQREVGKLTVFDFIVAITMGSVAGASLADPQVHMIGPIISMATLALADIVSAYISLKLSKTRRVLEGEPVVVVQNGRILEHEMRKARLNLDNLLMGLRKKNILSPADVEFAILEADGSISVIPKSQVRPVTPADLGLATKYEGLATVLIEDGNILEDNLRENQLTREWLVDQLRMQGIADHGDVMAAVLDTQGRLYVSRRTQR